MAGHAYKAAVEELDNIVGRDLVSVIPAVALVPAPKLSRFSVSFDVPSVTASDTQDGPFRATVLEPVGKLNQYFSNVNSSIDKRNHKLIDYDSARSKMRKLVEKPADDSTKLPRVSWPRQTKLTGRPSRSTTTRRKSTSCLTTS